MQRRAAESQPLLSHHRLLRQTIEKWINTPAFNKRITTQKKTAIIENTKPHTASLLKSIKQSCSTVSGNVIRNLDSVLRSGLVAATSATPAQFTATITTHNAMAHQRWTAPVTRCGL